MFIQRAKKATMVAPADALAGRPDRWFGLAERHLVLDSPLVTDEVPEGFEVAVFGLGCFWGAEEYFWQIPGVWSTSVGYAGGYTPHPSYEEVCSGRTGHTEAVRIVFDPTKVLFRTLVAQFFEIHDPTQGMRQGNDVGTQYRSAIYFTTPEQEQVAREMTKVYAEALAEHGITEPITTEIAPEPTYYYAEDYHQQYLVKVPHGYRCHANTGVSFPSGAWVGYLGWIPGLDTWVQ
jgi:peptide-methionine (S)-S-oxide reductase